MYAGYMDKVNGTVDLAGIIPDIINQIPGIFFLFVGSGPEENRIVALCQRYPDKVKMQGRVPYEEMPAYYQMCDVFVIPRPPTTHAEIITPLKLLEVMSMEKAVLGSDVGGISEVIRHGENGYLFEKGNMKSFSETLLQVIDSDNSRIGKNARESIMEKYTWDKSAKILTKVYGDLACFKA
jgi:glycosyltransferase involved in cell wall biosynthesis